LFRGGGKKNLMFFAARKAVDVCWEVVPSFPTVPGVCSKWGIPFSIVEDKTEILEILLW
jgi:hypothetical protein